ncbi:Ankyrin repeat-containing domain protein [Rhypophila sp. PSN 637]
MAHPLSTSASIAGLVQLCGIIFHSTYKFIKSAKEAPESAEKLATEIRNLSGVLQSLELLATSQAEVDTEEESTDFSSPSFRATQLSLCRQTLLKIKNGVEKAQDDFGKSNSKVSKIRRSLKWPFSEDKTQSLLYELSRHKETVLLAAAAGSMCELRKVLAGQSVLQTAISELKAVMVKWVEVEQRVEVDSTRAKIRDYFLRVNPKTMLDSCLKLRQPMTGLWLTDTNEFFLLWKGEPNAKLWLTGITGCGKTILCASVIESLVQETDAQTGLAYFFCRYVEPTTQNLHPPRGLPRTPDMDDLLRLLEEICGLFDKVFLVIDGVDECSKSAAGVAKSLCELGSRAKTASLAVFSRKEEELSATLAGEFEHVDIVANTHDIQLYVSPEMKGRRELCAIESRNPELCQMIHDRLVNEASGMFRWVACQLDYICDLDSDKARLWALSELPPTLHETYDRILQRASQERSRKDVVELGFSPRQLCEVVSIEPKATSITEDEIVDEVAILRRCSSLIRRSTTGNRFELAHFTVKEYLQTIDPESPLAIFRYDEYEAAQSITATSLRYLMFIQFGRKPRSDDAFLRSLSEGNDAYQFYPYAAAQWTKASLVQDDGEILRLSRKLFRADTPCYLNWAIQFLCDVIGVSAGVNDGCRDVTTRAVELRLPKLQMGAALGRAGICEDLSDEGATNSEPRKAFIGSALDCALGGPRAILGDYSDHTNRHANPPFLARTLNVLLSRAGANASRKPPHFSSLIATSHGAWALAMHRLIQNSFIRAGWERLGEDSQASPILHRMVEMVQRHLTATGQWDEFEHCGTFETTSMSLAELSEALLNAVKKGDARQIAPLLTDPRSIHLQSGGYGLASLRWAVSRGHREALEALLSEGDENLTRADHNGDSLLHYCRQNLHYSCLELLISHGLDTLTPNFSGKTVWHLAASHGSTRLLKLLLQTKDTAVALQMATVAGRRPLEEALYHGHAEAASLLIQGGLPSGHSLPCGLPLPHMATVQRQMDPPLRPGVRPHIVRHLKTLYDVRKPRQDGLTAVEVLLLEGSTEFGPNKVWMIRELLPDDHLVSLGDVHIWEFFASQVVRNYKSWHRGSVLGKQRLPSEADALIAGGALVSYERLRGQSACLPLFEARKDIDELGVPSGYYAIIEAVVRATEVLEPLRQCPTAIRLLKKVIRDAPMMCSSELLGLLLNRVGVNPTVQEEGQSALEYLLFGSDTVQLTKDVRLRVFRAVTRSMELGRLNDLLPSGRGLLDHIIVDSSRGERLGLTRCLLDKGADPNTVCSEQYSRRPAIVAAGKVGCPGMMRLLLEYGANPLSRDSNGWDLANQTRAGEVRIHGCNLLHVAAFFGSTSIIKHLWQKGVLGDTNAKSANLLTPLHLAVVKGKPKAIEVLAKDLGADAFARDRDGQLPSDVAVTPGHPKTTATLLYLTAGNATYLELSIYRGMFDLYRLIIHRGCSVDCTLPSCGGCTPLFVAVRAGKVNIARWLLESGARALNIQCPIHIGESSTLEVAVLYLPTEHEFLQDLLTKLLEQRRSVCIPELLSAARTAIYTRHLPALLAIVSHIREHAVEYKLVIGQATVAGDDDPSGCLLNLDPPKDHRVDTHGWRQHSRAGSGSSWPRIQGLVVEPFPLLHLAAQEGLLPAAEILVSHGADMELLDGNLRTPLAIAAAEGKLYMTKYLLDRGAMVDPLDRYGSTPLMLAAARQSLDVVETLEAHGADMSKLDAQVFHHLLRRGLDPCAPDNIGRCPIHLVISRGPGFRSGVWDMGLLLPLLDGPFNVLSDLVFSMEPSALPRLFRCLPRDKAEVLINQPGPGRDRRSPLCALAITGDVATFQVLLRLGVDVEVKGSEHGTPLMAASAHGRLELVKLLVFVEEGGILDFKDGCSLVVSPNRPAGF